jgi:hypothetical protein
MLAAAVAPAAVALRLGPGRCPPTLPLHIVVLRRVPEDVRDATPFHGAVACPGVASR